MRGSSVEVTVYDEFEGRAGSNVVIYLEKMMDGAFCPISRSQADSQGVCKNLLRKGYLITSGLCQLKIDLNAIFASDPRRFKFPYICVHFWTTGEDPYNMKIKVALYENSYTVFFS